MAKRRSASRRAAASSINPFGKPAPPPRGVRPTSFGTRVAAPVRDPAFDEREARLYQQVAPGMRGSGTARSPEAASAASLRRGLDASKISDSARAQAYRDAMLDEGPGEPVEQMGIDEFEQGFEQPAQQGQLGMQGRFEEAAVFGPSVATSTGTIGSRYVPPPVTRHEQAPDTPTLHLRSIAPTDVDRLWDWIRADGDGGTTFFGRTFDHGMELYHFCSGLGTAEAKGIAYARTIAYGGTHLGFLVLSPIISTDRVAILHTYLGPHARANAEALIPMLVQLAESIVPGFKLAVPCPSDEWRKFYTRVLTPLGFAPHTLFVR